MLIKDAEMEQIHIDFVPLADVLFNLLIFFLLATTIVDRDGFMLEGPRGSFLQTMRHALSRRRGANGGGPFAA